MSQISRIKFVEKFQISGKNLNNLWSLIEIYAVFVLNLCGKKSVLRKNYKYEVCEDRVADLYSEVIKLNFCLDFGQDFELEVQARF